MYISSHVPVVRTLVVSDNSCQQAVSKLKPATAGIPVQGIPPRGNFKGELEPQIGRLRLLDCWCLSRFSWSSFRHCLAGPKCHIRRDAKSCEAYKRDDPHNQCFFLSTTTKTMTKMTKTFWIIVDETKTKTKMKTTDDNDIKINSILVLTTWTRISKATFGTLR